MTSPEASGGQSLRLLHLEDDARDAELALDVLAQGGFRCDEERVETQGAFVRALEHGRAIDLILADYMLPGFDAREGLSIARRLRPDVPFIIISGRIGEEAAIDMLHAGATDYVLKHRMERLVPAVRRALRERALEQERQLAVAQLADVSARLEERSLLEQVVEQMPGGIILTQAPSGRILALNRHVESIFELDRSELRAVPDIARAAVYLLDGSRAKVEDLPTFRALRTGEVVRDAHLEFRHRDGHSVVALISSAPIRDMAGNVLAVVSSYTDITELRRAQAEVRSVAEFPEESPNPVIRVSSAGAVLYANGPAKALLGGLGWQAGDAAPDELLQHVLRVSAQGAVQDVELSGPGDRVHLFTFSPSATNDYVNLYGRDITDRKRSEDALREADRRKSEFLGVLSHELRNPLAPIRNAIHILEWAPEGGDRARRARAVIARQTGQLSRLVDDLLDVTRVSRGKIRLRRAPVEVTELVRQAVEDHRPLFEARSIALALHVSASPQWIEADATRITQAVGNLLQNAVKFTNAHGRVDVSVERQAPSEVAIRVTDDGIGISPPVLAHVFEPFTQADESLHRAHGGLGLGLALVKGFVELHGGRVEVHSRGQGTGSEFTIHLPVAHEVGPARDVAAPAPSRERLRLLVIEDNLDAADTIKEVLEMNGHEAAIAHDGEEGVAKARSLEPDAVLCDIGLPGLDGYEVARVIRSDPTISPTLIAMTGYTSAEDRAKTFKAGFDFHLGKPVEIHELERVLGSITARPTSRRVLVVDDDDALRSNIKELLEDDGWEVREARDGEEALEVVAGFKPSVMLLDYRLPGMDGGEILRRLDAIQANPRVVLMTGSPEVRRIAAEHGLRFFVPKPFRGNDLLDAVEDAREAS